MASASGEEFELKEQVDEGQVTKGKKVFRHNTDLPRFGRVVTDQRLIIPDDDPVFGHMNHGCEDILEDGPHLPMPKKTVQVFRHHTDVFQHRRQSAPTVVAKKPQATRRSVSRQGSKMAQDFKPASAKPQGRDPKLDKFILEHKKTTDKTALYTAISEAEDELQAHREQAATHVHTKLFDEALVKVQETNYVVLTGSIGVGKTYTAMSLVDHMVDTNPELRPLIVCSPSAFKELVDITENLIVVVDDFGGDVLVNELEIMEWNQNANLLSVYLKDKKLYAIFTTRNDVIETLKADTVNIKSIICSDQVINLDEAENALKENEKAELCMKYAKHKNIPVDKQSVSFLDSANGILIGFPLLCKLMTRNNFNKVFENPTGTIETQMNQVAQEAKSHFIVLILTFLFGGYLPNDKLTDYQDLCYDKVRSIVKIRKNFAKITSTAEGLVGTILKYRKQSDSYEFVHPILFQEIMRWFWSHQREEFIEMCPLKCFSCLNIRNTDFEIEVDYTGAPYIEPEHYCSVLDRLKYEIETGNVESMQQVAALKLWDYENFVQKSFQYLTVDFFFVKDKVNFCLFPYFAKFGKYNIVKRIIESMKVKAKTNIFNTDVQKGLELACRGGLLDMFKILTELCDELSDSVILAAAEGGDVEIMKIIATKVDKLDDITSQDGLTITQLACLHGHSKLMKYLYQYTTGSLSKRDLNGRSILHQAVIGGSKGCLKFLLSNNETIDTDLLTRTKTGTTLLHTACEYGRIGIVKYLCKLFPSMLLSVNQEGFLPADYSVIEGHVDCLVFVVNQQKDSDIVNNSPSFKGNISEGRTMLHLACLAGKLQMVRYLCKTFPDMIKSENNDSLLPVHDAIMSEHIEILDYLIANGHGPMIFTSDGRTILHIAAFEGKLNVVKYIASKYPALLKICDSDGNTVAHDASASGQVGVLQYLIEKGVDPGSRNYDGCSILHDAAYFGRLEMVTYLCQKYPNMLQICSNSGYSVAHAAALGGNVEILRTLISSGGAQILVSKDLSTLLHEAAYSGQLEMVQFLCSAYPDMVKSRTKNSFTACHYAVQEGHEEVAEYLLGKMGDATILTDDEETLLHIATYNGRLGMVKYLSREFPELVRWSDASGASILHAAARGGHIEMISYLIDQSLDPSALTVNGSSILHLAAYDGRLEMTKFLCSKFPDMIGLTDLTGHSPGHYAAGSGNVDLFKYLLSKGIDPTAQTENGSSCLLKAAYTGKLEMVEYLINNFPELLKIEDQYDCTAAHYSASEGHIHVLKYLLSKGISPVARTVDGHTILHISAFHGRAEIVAFLCKEYPDLIPLEDKAGQTVWTFADIGGHENISEYLRKNIKKKHRRQNKDISHDTGRRGRFLEQVQECWLNICLRIRTLFCCCRNN